MITARSSFSPGRHLKRKINPYTGLQFKGGKEREEEREREREREREGGGGSAKISSINITANMCKPAKG